MKVIVDDSVRQKAFLEALADCRGIIADACRKSGVSRSQYYAWWDMDDDFKAAVNEVQDTQIDFVEGQLLKKIQDGDTTSIIFYLKTKGKGRGYSEKALAKPSEPAPVAALPAELTRDDVKCVEAKVKNKKAYIVKLLKAQGKYTAELTYQVDITAKLLVRADMLGDEIMANGHRAINVEYSREGNERKTIDPKEKLYIELLEKGQKALRALGMNTESKERQTSNDEFSGFLAGLRREDEE